MGIDASFCDKFPREKRAGAGVGDKGVGRGGVRKREVTQLSVTCAGATLSSSFRAPPPPHARCTTRARIGRIACAQRGAGAGEWPLHKMRQVAGAPAGGAGHSLSLSSEKVHWALQ